MKCSQECQKNETLLLVSSSFFKMPHIIFLLFFLEILGMYLMGMETRVSTISYGIVGTPTTMENIDQNDT